MSHYKPYPAYKDSGVEWLGQVPEGWSVVPLKWLFDCLDGQRVPLNSEQRSDIKGNIPYWGSGGVVDYIEKYIFDEPLILLGEDGAPFFERDRPVAYDIDGKSWVNNHIHVLKPLSNYPMKWFVHVLNCVEYRLYIDGSTRDKLTQDSMKGIVVVLPTCLDEAVTIVAHLDRETARIDGLVSRKTRFIELLREKRQALITHAVTKGLNPDTPMKDSGVEWLGDVPEGWELTYIKRVISSISQGWSPECEARPADDDEWAVLKVGCVNGEKFRSTENKALPKSLSPKPELGLKKGDVLVSRANTRELVGGCAVIPQDFPQLMICDKLYRLIANKKALPEFLAALISVYGRREIEVEANGASASMVNIAQSVILNLQVALPLRDEQTLILDFLDRETTRIDTLISKTERSIELLKERRSALITAAVTGQIDLRETR